MTVFIPLNKIMGYLGQTSICINFEKDADRLEQKRQIAQEEIQKYPQLIDARKAIDLDNAIIKRFKQEKIFY
jgi:hypothetical protein